MALGWPSDPDDLFVNDDGSRCASTRRFSWEYPLSVHGLMHNVITNAWRGDPYRIDTLLIFMANMAWNSTMNTVEVRKMLNDKDEDGEYKIPFLVVCDAFQSEMTAFADLILPDTTYLERHDVMSMLDRPISEFDGPVDSVRIPVVPPTGRLQAVPGSADRTRHARLKLPAFVTPEGSASSATTPTSSSTTRPSPARASASWPAGAARAARSSSSASPTRSQWEMYAEEQLRLPPRAAAQLPVHAQLEQGLPRVVARNRITRYAEPILIHLYSEVLQTLPHARRRARAWRASRPST